MRLFNLFEDEITEEEKFEIPEFKIPVHNLSYLELKVEELNKKAAKVGSKPIEIKYGRKVIEKLPDTDELGIKEARYQEYQYVTVEGDIPKLPGGWMFVGKLEPFEGSSPVVKSVPGQEIPKRYREKQGNECEHCNRKRPRSESFILKNESDKYIQVGRSCLKDFLGHANPERYATWAEMLYMFGETLKDPDNENYYGSSRAEPKYTVERVLAVAAAAINRDGFVGSQSYDKKPTKSTVWTQFNPPIGRERQYWTPLEITPAEEQMAQRAIVWGKQQAQEKQNDDFWYNMSKFVNAQVIESKYFGYLCALMFSFMKNENALKQKESMKTGIVSGAMGAEGTKVSFKATVISAFKYQRQSYHYGDTGVSQVLTMKTEDNHLVKMFSANLDIKKDDVVTITGKLGEAKEETYEKSPFKGIVIQMMAPRSRIVADPPPTPALDTDPTATEKGLPQFSNIISIQGYAPDPARQQSIKVIGKRGKDITVEITPADGSSPFQKTFYIGDVKFGA